MSLTTNIFKHGIQYNKTRSRTKLSDFDSYVAFVSSKWPIQQEEKMAKHLHEMYSGIDGNDSDSKSVIEMS